MVVNFEAEWSKANSTVNDWLFYAGYEAEDCRNDSGGENQNHIREWVVPNDHTNVYITLARSDERIDAQVYAPLCTVSKEDKKLQLYTEILNLNATTLSCCAFGLEEGNKIVVIADRGAMDFTLFDLDEMMHNVKRVASEYCSEFIKRYEAQRVDS